jgi:hypothetical protein
VDKEKEARKTMPLMRYEPHSWIESVGMAYRYLCMQDLQGDAS